jgi:hypothetical protein
MSFNSEVTEQSVRDLELRKSHLPTNQLDCSRRNFETMVRLISVARKTAEGQRR